MKRLLCLALATSISHLYSQAQSSAGLIAHWPMTANAQDSTGNGHNGTMHNLTPAAGKDGMMGSALYFSGVSSAIRVPNDADLNLSAYSICATVKPTAFWTGKCAGNVILFRGAEFATGHYGTLMFENPYDDNCDAVDTNNFVFCNEAGSNVPLINQWQYNPRIHTNGWYSLVATYENGSYRIWVDGDLKSSPSVTSSNPIGNSNAGITIGRSDWGDTVTYPFPFKGVIDDIRLYDRVLTTQEIQDYTESTTLSTGDIQKTVVDEAAYPNPSNGMFYLEPKLAAQEHAELTVTNAFGQAIHSISITGSHSVQVDLSSQANGIYYWKYVGSEGRPVGGKVTIVH